MGKVSSLLLVLLVAGAIVAMTWRREPAAATASVRAEADAGATAVASGSLPAPSASTGTEDDAGVGPGEVISGSNDAGGALIDGSKAPPLPADAPKQVAFGIVLVRYAGAEGAHAGTRTREQAKVLAEELGKLAGTDWKAAVQKGDKGSAEQAGSLPRGVLEPGPEYVLFTLPKGGVGGPVDAPTGYWIVKRNE